MNRVRIQKLISECGVTSRRKAEEMISKGRVKVNGHPVRLGDKADLRTDNITVDGKRISKPQNSKYIMLNKPRGYVTTLSDEFGRKCIAQLTADVGERVFPVGRLDRDSEGLLLLTNDGEFANMIIHPSRHIPKVYRATLKPGPTDEQLIKFRNGMMLKGDSRKTAPADINVISQSDDGFPPSRAVAEIVLYEGRNRQIRRMFEQMSIKVARLRRIAIGNVSLERLVPGKWRELDKFEVESLINTANRRGDGTADKR